MRGVGWALLAAELPIALLISTAPPSWSAAGYLLGLVLITASLVARPIFGRSRLLLFLGASIMVAPLLVRLIAVQPMGSLRAIDRLIDERDVSINAARAIRITGLMRDPDVPAVPEAMRSAYDQLSAEEGALLPSPFVATYLGLQRPGASDTLEIAASGKGTVIFLHGFAGNFTMSCWLFARAAKKQGLGTVCPSTGWIGDWWSAQGEAIVRDTIRSLRSRGEQRIYLAGLSNGAIGASRLAPRLSDQIAGLVLLSGAASDAPSPDMPTLVIHGRDDAQIPSSIARAYAQRVGARYVELPAGHFVLLLLRDRVAQIIGGWFEERAL
jgi:hypothetical protein